LQARDKFELKGRVAVAAAGEGFNARLRWTQDGKQTRMSLDGPLAAGGVQLLQTAPLSASVTHRRDRSTTMPRERKLAKPDWVSIRRWTVCA